MNSVNVKIFNFGFQPFRTHDPYYMHIARYMCGSWASCSVFHY